MKNKFLFFLPLVACLMLTFSACTDKAENDSVPHTVSLPGVKKLMGDAYYYGLGSTNIFNDLPNIVAIYVDSIYGFEGGYGGKTKADSLKIFKSDIVGWGDTMNLGSSSLQFKKVYNKGNYAVQTSTDLFIIESNPNPGPTALEGVYKRNTAAGYLLRVVKAAPGLYVIYNPGGAASVGDNPYLIYNYKNATGADSLSFKVQKDLCGGGLRLVSPAAPLGLAAGDYDIHPPIIAATAPLTLQWKVFEFEAADDASVHPGAALCNWC